jgi:MFS family permease
LAFPAAASWYRDAINPSGKNRKIDEQQVVSITPTQYFRKRRGLANGIVYAGGGIGGAVISLSMSAIVERLGAAWAFRLIGLVMLATGLPAAWFIKERTPVRAATFVEW